MRGITTAPLLLACALVACGDSRVPEPSALRNPLPEDEGAGPIDALSRRYGRLRQRLAERGYDEELGVSRLFLLDEEGRVLPLDLAGGRCTTLLAIAGGSIRELAMSVHDGEGAEVASDVVEGEGGLVHVCPQPAEPVATLPHYLALRASGSGSVILSAHGSAPGAGEGFAGLFDGVLAPQVPFRSVEEQLARSRTVLRARGLLPVAEPRLESLAEGEGMRVPVELETDRCYVVIARGGEGLRDVDLVLYDAAGAEVARDLESDVEPSLELCPEEAAHIVVEASAYEGAGAVGVLVLAGPSEDAGDAVPAAPTEPASDATPAERSAGDDPVTSLMGLATNLTARGYGAPTVVVADGYISPGEVRAHEVLVRPGCAVIIGTARNDTDLDLYLSDDAGRALDRDTGIQPVARVRACTTSPVVVTVTVKSYGRRSVYALATLTAPDTIADVQTLRLEEAVAGLRERGYTPVDTVSQTLDHGERFERTISLTPGRCTVIAVAGDLGVEDVDLFVHDVDGELIASSSSPEPYAAVNRCAPPEGETLRFSVLMYRGAGAVQVTRLEGAP